MQTQLRTHDWVDTPLGALETWPQSLRTALDICLALPDPASVLWGAQHFQFYNDAYTRTFAHGEQGAALQTHWPDNAAEVKNHLERILADQGAGVTVLGPPSLPPEQTDDGIPVTFASTFTPIRDESGAVGGILQQVRETTQNIRAYRQQQKAAQDADNFRATEALLRQQAALIDLVDDPIIVCRQDGSIVQWNTGAERLYGYTKAEALGQSIYALLDAVHPYPVEDVLRALETTGEWTGELHDTAKDGRTLIVESRQRLFRVDGEQFVLEVNRDITARRQAEDALRESEARFRHMADHAPMMVWATEAGGRTYYLSQSWYELTGQVPGPEADDDWIQAMHPDDRPAAQNAFASASARRQMFRAEYRVRRHDGAYRWVIDSGQPRFDAQNKFQGYIGSIIDITDRREAEEARRVSEERFRAIVNQNLAGIVEMDLDGNLVFVNPQFSEKIGYSIEALKTMRVSDVTHAEDLARCLELMDQMKRTCQPFEIEKRLVRNDGSIVWVNNSITPITDATGQPQTATVVCMDITDRKRAEGELRTALEAVERANADLERRVAERTEELARVSQIRQELLRQLVSAQEQERARIARDLHDDSGQQMTALLLGLGNLKSHASLAAPEPQSLLEQLQALAGDVAQKAHRMAFTLRPTALDDIGLVGALENYAEQWERWSGLPAHVTFLGGEEGKKRLPQEIETTIYRVAQESLTNVLRHAVLRPGATAKLRPGKVGKRGATQVNILIRCGPREVVTIIEDDGPGFDTDAVLTLPPGQRRLGIFGMQERAQLAGGSLTIESEPGQGTTLFLRLPLPHA